MKITVTRTVWRPRPDEEEAELKRRFDELEERSHRIWKEISILYAESRETSRERSVVLRRRGKYRRAKVEFTVEFDGCNDGKITPNDIEPKLKARILASATKQFLKQRRN